MKNILILIAFVFFICYTIVSAFWEIPSKFNTILYVIITVLAVFFGAFYTDIGKGIKDKFKNNFDKKYGSSDQKEKEHSN